MYFKQKVVISNLRGKPLKLVDQFTYLGGNISSTESIQRKTCEALNAIDRLSLTWKSNPSDKIKRYLF